MDKSTAITELKDRILSVWKGTRNRISDNIIRGHYRSISEDVEDSVALFISHILNDKVEIFIDPSVYIEHKTHRPDIIVAKDGKVLALIEMKASMGWCRDATKVIDDEIMRMHDKFLKAKNIHFSFKISETEKDKHSLRYNNDVKLFLISLSANNGAKGEQLDKNIKYAESKGISHYLLFDGWYDKLTDRDINKFAEELESMKS